MFENCCSKFWYEFWIFVKNYIFRNFSIRYQKSIEKSICSLFCNSCDHFKNKIYSFENFTNVCQYWIIFTFWKGHDKVNDDDFEKYHFCDDKYEFFIRCMFFCLIQFACRTMFNVLFDFTIHFWDIYGFDEFCINSIMLNVIISIMNQFKYVFFAINWNAQFIFFFCMIYEVVLYTKDYAREFFIVNLFLTCF